MGDRIQRVGRPSQEDSGAGQRDVFLVRNETRIEEAKRNHRTGIDYWGGAVTANARAVRPGHGHQ